jgi:PAT family beta-lactamase induction signal transducer AmpG
MIDITNRSGLKYLLFGSLYVAEGIEFALATLIISYYLSDKGIPVPIVTAIAAGSLLPWTMKFFWGIIADRLIIYGRKKFIILGGLIAALGLFILIFIDPALSLIPFAFFLLFSHIGVSFLDVTADAWAIQISEEKERGKIAGSMYMGLFFGQAGSTIFLAYIASIYSYNMAFIIAGILILLILIFPLVVKEKIIVKKRQKIKSLIIREYKKRTTQLITFLGPVAAVSGGIMYFVVPLYMKNVLNLTLAQTGILASIFPIMMGAGAFVGGIITDKVGRKFALYLFFGGSSIVFASLVLGTEWITFTIIYGLVGLMIGGYHAAICALIMDITNPKIGATQYSLITSIFNVGEWTGGTLGGTFVLLLGYGRAFLYSGWFFGPALIVLYLIKIKKSKKNEKE